MANKGDRQEAIKEAIRTSELSGRNPFNEIREGTLAAADGTPLLESINPGRLTEMAGQYASDLHKRAESVGEPLSKEGKQMSDQTDFIKNAVEKVYVDPEGVLGRYEEHSSAGHQVGLTDLGDLRKDAPEELLDEGLLTKALAANEEIRNRNPELVAATEAARERVRDQKQAETLLNEIEPHGRTSEARGGPEQGSGFYPKPENAFKPGTGVGGADSLIERQAKSIEGYATMVPQL